MIKPIPEAHESHCQPPAWWSRCQTPQSSPSQSPSSPSRYHGNLLYHNHLVGHHVGLTVDLLVHHHHDHPFTPDQEILRKNWIHMPKTMMTIMMMMMMMKMKMIVMIIVSPLSGIIMVMTKMKIILIKIGMRIHETNTCASRYFESWLKARLTTVWLLNSEDGFRH